MIKVLHTKEAQFYLRKLRTFARGRTWLSVPLVWQKVLNRKPADLRKTGDRLYVAALIVDGLGWRRSSKVLTIQKVLHRVYLPPLHGMFDDLLGETPLVKKPAGFRQRARRVSRLRMV